MKDYEKIQKYMERGAKILGTQYAIIGGAMTWISESNLVSAISNAGAFGVWLPAQWTEIYCAAKLSKLKKRRKKISA